MMPVALGTSWLSVAQCNWPTGTEARETEKGLRCALRLKPWGLNGPGAAQRLFLVSLRNWPTERETSEEKISPFIWGRAGRNLDGGLGLCQPATSIGFTAEALGLERPKGQQR